MSTTPLVVIDIVGLTPDLLGEHTPHLNALASDGFMATLDGVFPAVTCTAQASMLTGAHPAAHGIVANGWYFHELAEVLFWRQPNWLVEGEKVWESARTAVPDFTCAQLFWWYNMYASVDLSVTPRPIYPADGRKIPELYSSPPDLQAKLQQELGTFPFFNFWGPTADIRSSKWIAACARRVFDDHRPTLSLVYLPHLDYNLQRLGPSDPAIRDDVAAIDTVAGELIDHVRGAGAEVLVVSEYGISDVTGPVHINRVLRDNGYIAVRETLGWELLDCGASRAFAVADHQVAHVYVRDPSDVAEVAALLARTDGIEHVLDEDRLRAEQLDHARSGQLVAVAEADRWFSYYYWLDDTRAPDFAPTVDIHRKPGYDPAEMFVDPAIRFPKLKAGLRVAQKKLGFRMLMDMIPLNADMVRGSHGRHAPSADTGPLAIGSRRDLATDRLPMTGIKALMLNHW